MSAKPASAAPRPNAPKWLRESGVRAIGADTARRILIVDDEPLMLRSCRRLLVTHRVETVSSIADAKRVLLDEAFDVVFTDVAMPDGGGIALHRWMQTSFGVAAPRVVFFSGGLDPDDKRYIQASGCACLSKPFDAAAFRKSAVE